MIPSVTTASFFHRGNAHGESTVLVELADDMALGPPIHWIILLVVGIISLEPLINLLDGLWLTFPFMVLSSNTNITKTTQYVYHSYVGSSRIPS